MTEKRFKLIDGIKKGTHSGIWDNQKQHNQGIGDELWLGEVVGMLNEGVILAEENKELKKTVSYFAEVCACSIEVMNEDENLKKVHSAIICTEMQELLKENKELKNEIKMLKTIIGKNEYYIGNITHKGKWR